MEANKIRVAISHGDINGINYELLLKCFSEPALLDLFTPVIYGSLTAYNFWKDRFDWANPSWNIIDDARGIRNGQVNLINCDEGEVEIHIGEPRKEAGLLAYKALDRAVTDVMQGRTQVLVTAPINKATMPLDLFPYKGHTKYLEVRGAETEGESLMILTAQDCRVALVTEHLPLAKVSQELTKDLIVSKAKVLDEGLRRNFAITKPRIALLSLNPHAGDMGLLGSEEDDCIRPALEELKAEGILAFGPYPADAYFSTALLDTFDAVLAMYHDQGLAPFKAMYMNEGVNSTLGLSFIRTSPDHGTAYDIAGQDKAEPSSLRSAIYQALDMYRARRNDDYAKRNPLRNTYFNRGRDDDRFNLEDTYNGY